MYIYKTTNNINGLFYIGKCEKSIESSTTYFGSGLKLLKAIHKYGKDNFSKEIICECDSLQELNEKEIYYIQYYNSIDRNVGYNLALGGSGGDLITYHPNRDKIIENCSGSGNQFFGKQHSEETKQKISLKRKGVKNSPETNEKIKLTLLRKYANNEIIKTISDEMKQKISAANTGRKHTLEELQKISESSKGEKNSSAKKWIFEHIDGTEVIIKGNFQAFCKTHNLSIKAMRNISEGKRKDLYYNEWTVRRI